MTYIADSKYKQFVADMDSHFSRVKITNFDLINHHCRGDRLQNSRRDFKTIFDKDFQNYEDHAGNQVILFTVKTERDDIHFERSLLKSHIKSNIEMDLISNSSFIKKTRKKLMTNNCKSLKLQGIAKAYEAESDFCMAVLNSLHEKYKGQVEMKFSASYQHMRNAIHSKKKFRTEDI